MTAFRDLRKLKIAPLLTGMSHASPIKKLILYLGQPEFEAEKVREDLAQEMGSRANPLFVFAKDGAEAERRIANQKFDAIVIDHKAPRLLEGHFLQDLKTSKNAAGAAVIVLVPQENWVLPPELNEVEQRIVTPFTSDILVRALAKAMVLPAPVAKAAFAVDARVVNALVKATGFICQQYGMETGMFQKPQIRKNSESWAGDIAASIEIKSRLFQGLLLVSFDQKVYLKMLENMLGEAQAEINDENKDAIGELANQILGNAKSDFTQYEVGMSIPQILAKGNVPSCPSGTASILLTAQTDFGSYYIEVMAFPVVAGKAA